MGVRQVTTPKTRKGDEEAIDARFQGVLRLAGQMCEQIPSNVGKNYGYNLGCPLVESLFHRFATPAFPSQTDCNNSIVCTTKARLQGVFYQHRKEPRLDLRRPTLSPISATQGEAGHDQSPGTTQAFRRETISHPTTTPMTIIPPMMPTISPQLPDPDGGVKSSALVAVPPPVVTVILPLVP
jgi:hypothetical protein